MQKIGFDCSISAFLQFKGFNSAKRSAKNGKKRGVF